jgi:carbamoyl-phosphate synthase large subunit
MRSTGEVMGISDSFAIAFAKSQIAAGTLLPRQGRIFLSVASAGDKVEMVALARRLSALGFDLMATSGTARALSEAGVVVEVVKKLQEGHPNLVDHLIDGRVQLIFNTPRGKGARTDEGRIRAASVLYGVPCITTLAAAEACVLAMEATHGTPGGPPPDPFTVQPIQDRFPEPVAAR